MWCAVPKGKFKGGGKTKSRVSLEGKDELEKDLEELGEGVRDVLEAAAAAGAVIVLARARAKAPQRTGNLAANLEAKKSGKTKNNAAQTVGPNKSAPYGAQVELGHNIVRNGAVVGHVPPKPYLRPAILESQVEVESAVAKIFAAAIDKVG